MGIGRVGVDSPCETCMSADVGVCVRAVVGVIADCSWVGGYWVAVGLRELQGWRVCVQFGNGDKAVGSGSGVSVIPVWHWWGREMNSFWKPTGGTPWGYPVGCSAVAVGMCPQNEAWEFEGVSQLPRGG